MHDTNTNIHQHETCTGCDHIHDLDELVVVLRQPKHTLYKRTNLPFPYFPRRLNRGRVAVCCYAVKEYLEAVAK